MSAHWFNPVTLATQDGGTWLRGTAAAAREGVLTVATRVGVLTAPPVAAEGEAWGGGAGTVGRRASGSGPCALMTAHAAGSWRDQGHDLGRRRVVQLAAAHHPVSRVTRHALQAYSGSQWRLMLPAKQSGSSQLMRPCAQGLCRQQAGRVRGQVRLAGRSKQGAAAPWLY